VSLLDICQRVARVIPIAVPSIIVGSSDSNATLLLGLAQDEGEALARRIPSGWTSQIIEHTFATDGTGDYTLPTDYQRMVDGTLWDRSRFWEMRGAMSPSQWQLYKSSPIGRASIQRRWRIRVPSGSGAGTPVKFSIDPTPTDTGSTLVFEYVTNAWCKSASGTAQTSWQADTDTGILDEYLMRLGLKWRVLERLSGPSDAALAEYESMVDKAVASDGGAQVLDMTSDGGSYLLNYLNVPESGYGA